MDGSSHHRNKAAFSCLISVDSSSNRRNEGPFSGNLATNTTE